MQLVIFLSIFNRPHMYLNIRYDGVKFWKGKKQIKYCIVERDFFTWNRSRTLERWIHSRKSHQWTISSGGFIAAPPTNGLTAPAFLPLRSEDLIKHWDKTLKHMFYKKVGRFSLLKKHTLKCKVGKKFVTHCILVSISTIFKTSNIFLVRQSESEKINQNPNRNADNQCFARLYVRTQSW